MGKLLILPSMLPHGRKSALSEINRAHTQNVNQLVPNAAAFCRQIVDTAQDTGKANLRYLVDFAKEMVQ